MNQPARKTILVIHGPNLNMLGSREPSVYGEATLADIDAELTADALAMNMTVELFQSNHEGAIVDRIQSAANTVDGVIINPGAYTHTSVAIRDALLLLDVPIIEVHLSNVYKREAFRHKSLISDVVTGKIVGCGAAGYRMALSYFVQSQS